MIEKLKGAAVTLSGEKFRSSEQILSGQDTRKKEGEVRRVGKGQARP